jgi:colanic acid/amylovoran biosynthesis glycosyltransferase
MRAESLRLPARALCVEPRPLRIAFFVSRFPALSETFILHQITGLLALGHDVDIYARSAQSCAKQHAEIGDLKLLDRTRYLRKSRRGWAGEAEVLRATARDALLGDRKLWRALLPSPNDSHVGRRARWHGSHTLVDRAPYDIVQAHFGANGNLAAELQRLGMLGGRLVTMFHGSDLRRGAREGGQIYAPLLERDSTTLAISAHSRNELVRIGFPASRILYHPVGIPVRRYANRSANADVSSEADRPLRILTIARLVEEKGLQFALEAVRGLRVARPGLRLEYRIAGEGELEPALRRLVAELGIGDCVRFLGPADQDEIRRELGEAQLVLLPSIAEVLPVCLMEAQASGLPVIATDVGAVREVVLDGLTGRVVPPSDASALVSALCELIDARSRWPTLGAAGRAHVAKHFDSEVLNARLVGIYRDLLSTAPRERAH